MTTHWFRGKKVEFPWKHLPRLGLPRPGRAFHTLLASCHSHGLKHTTRSTITNVLIGEIQEGRPATTNRNKCTVSAVAFGNMELFMPGGRMSH